MHLARWMASQENECSLQLQLRFTFVSYVRQECKVADALKMKWIKPTHDDA